MDAAYIVAHRPVSIPALRCDSSNVEDIDDETGDGGHAFDGVTYDLQYKNPICGRVRLGGI